MLLSSKDYHKLVEISTQQEKTISSLETKLRIQMTISQDLDSLNKDFQKTIQELNEEIKEQQNKIGALEMQLLERKCTQNPLKQLSKTSEASKSKNPAFSFSKKNFDQFLHHPVPMTGIFTGLLIFIVLLANRFSKKTH